MSRTRTIPPIPEHVTDEAMRERKAYGTDRQAARNAERDEVYGRHESEGGIHTHRKPATAIARVLGTKKKEDE